jgi:hypothetical protein
MSRIDFTTVTWRRSSYSGWKKDSECVEVALAAGGVAVRDSKDPDGPVLVVSPAAFGRFLRSLR